MSAPPSQPDPVLARFHFAQMETDQRAQQRFKWIYFGLVAVGFVVGLLAMSQLAPDSGGLGVFAALLFAGAGGVVGIVLAPRFANPSITCPYCGARIPLYDLSKPVPTRHFSSRCGNCARDLPPAY